MQYNLLKKSLKTIREEGLASFVRIGVRKITCSLTPFIPYAIYKINKYLEVFKHWKQEWIGIGAINV